MGGQMEMTMQRGGTERTILPGAWLCFDLNDDEDLAARRFVAKHGRPPEQIIEWSGLLRVGPTPDGKGEVDR